MANFRIRSYEHILEESVVSKILDNAIASLVASYYVQPVSGSYCVTCSRPSYNCTCPADLEETPKIDMDLNIDPFGQPIGAYDAYLPKKPIIKKDLPKVSEKTRIQKVREHIDLDKEIKGTCYLCGLVRDLVMVKSSKIQVCSNCAYDHLVEE